MNKPIVVLDRGHGSDTKGKRWKYPDGAEIREWAFNDIIVKGIAEKLKSLNVDVAFTVTDDKDLPLQDRAKVANELTKGRNAIVLSIHGNAGQGTGWEAHTSAGNTKADEYSAIFFKHARNYFQGMKIRMGSNNPKDPDWDSNFYILRKTTAPAVLTENFFMDTRADFNFMQSAFGQALIINMHVSALKEIFKL